MMNEAFNKLKAPRRNETKQAQSLMQIKHKIRKQQVVSKAQYAVTLTATLATIFILVWSLVSAPNSVHERFTTASGGGPELKTVYMFDNFSVEPLYAIDAWYYPDKLKLEKDDKAFLKSIGEELRISSNYNSRELPAAVNDFLLNYEDGSKQYIQYWSTLDDQGKYQFAMDAETKQVINLTSTQQSLFEDIVQDKGSFLFSLLKIPLFLLGALLLLYIFDRFNLLGESTKAKFSRKPFIKGISIFTYYVIVQGTSLFLYDTTHGLFVISMLMLPFIIGSWRSYGKNNYTTSLWTLPLLALFFIYVVLVIKI